MSSTDRITPILEVEDNGKWIFITTPQYILRWYTERVRNHSRKSSHFWIRKQYGINKYVPSILRIIPVQRHVYYSFSLCTKDSYSNWVHTIPKFQMREIYTCLQLGCYLYPTWKTRALRPSRPFLLAPDFSKLFSWTDSNEGQLPDGPSTENSFFFAATGLTGTRLSLPFPRLETDQLQRGRLSLSCSWTYWTSPSSNIRDADSRAERSLTNSWWFNSFCTKTSFPCLFDCLSSQHDFLPIRLKISYHGSNSTHLFSTAIARQGSNSELCQTTSAAATAVFNMLIPVSEKKFLCVNRGWRKKSCTDATAPFTF